MKLRNKKTGEIFDLEKMPKWLRESIQITATFYSRECEVYEPVEPQIADEMAREIIKKWYNQNKLVGKLRSYGGRDWLGLRGSNSVGIDWKIELRVSYNSSLKDDKLYSLTELIGEEEE